MAIQIEDIKLVSILHNYTSDDYPLDWENKIPLHTAVNSGDLCLVKYFLSQKAKVNATNKKGFTALHLAILKRRIDIVNCLIKFGADVNFPNLENKTPLHLAVNVETPAIVELLLEKGVDVNQRTEYGLTALHFAVLKCNKEIIELLVDSEADINAIGYRDETALNIAVANESEDIVEFLLSHGAIANHGDKKDMLLHMAIYNKNSRLVELLLKYNADANVLYNGDSTALHMAAEYKCYRIVEMILEKSFDVDTRTIISGFTALHIAAQNNDLETCQVLMKFKANINLQDEIGRTPLCMAAKLGHDNIVCLLLSFEPDRQKNNLAIYYAVKDNKAANKNIVLQLISHGYSMDLLETWPKLYKDIFMVNSIKNGHTGIVEYLLLDGYDANKPIPEEIKETDCDSLIHLAVRECQLQSAEILLLCGSYVNKPDKYHQKPLFYAVENDYFEMAQLLLKNCATIDSSNNLLLMAARKNNYRMIKEMIRLYKNVNLEDKFGTTALHFAVWFEDEEVVQLLLENGAKCKTVDQSREVIFSYDLTCKIKCKYGDEAMEEFKKNILTTPLHIATRKNCSDIAEAILESGLSINCKDGCGRTPLHVAILCGKTGLIDLFLEFNADIYAKDSDGNTCIDYACNIDRFFQYMHMDKVFPYIHDLKPTASMYTYEIAMGAPELMIKYLVIDHVKNDKSCLQQVGSFKHLKNLYEDCMIEIALLKSTKIINGINLYDILIQNGKTLTSYLRNSKFIKAFESVMNEAQFPLYHFILKKRIRRYKERRLLLDEAHIYFTEILNLPILPTCRIMDYLYNSDLGRIRQAYEHIYHSRQVRCRK